MAFKTGIEISRCQDGMFLLTQIRSELGTWLCLLWGRKILHRRGGLWRVNNKKTLLSDPQKFP